MNVRDPINDVRDVREAGRLYTGDLDVAHPYISPSKGKFRGLAPMIVFAGTRDLFYPDSIDPAAIVQAPGVPIELHLTPEGRQARAIILRDGARTATGVWR